MPSRRTVLVAAGVLASAPIVTACSSASRPRPKASALIKLSYLTGFQDTPREQYARVALARGFFHEAGLDVTIQPGQPADFNFIQLETGRVQFASVDFVSAVRFLVDGRYHYQVVGTIQQKTLLGLASLASDRITEPSDLNGKTIGTAAGGAVESLFPVYAKLAGLNICSPTSGSPCTRVEWKHVAPDQIAQLLGARRVGAVGTYVCDTPNTQAAVGGQALNVLNYDRYLTDLLGTVVVASSKTIAAQPDVVRRFAQAIVKGTVYACDHPEETGRIINKALPATKPGPAGQVFGLMKPYLSAGGPPGTLEPKRVMRGIAILTSGGIVPGGAITPDKLCAFDLAPKAA